MPVPLILKRNACQRTVPWPVPKNRPLACMPSCKDLIGLKIFINRLLDKEAWAKLAQDKFIVTRLVFLLVAVAVICVSLHINQLHHSKAELAEDKEELKEEISSWEETGEYEVREMNITKYAPLDPAAIRGWDFAGDRAITASGQRVVPGETAAAGPNIPFGAEVYVEGKGWYKVNDRGSEIGPNDIDLAVDSKDRAQEWGRQDRFVIIKWP